MNNNNFITQLSPESEVAAKILKGARKMQWKGFELITYYQNVLKLLASGYEIDVAIRDVDFVLITLDAFAE